jgi:hypothetical protein
MKTLKPLIIHGLTEIEARNYFDRVLELATQEEDDGISTMDRENSPACLRGLLNTD